MLEKLEGYQQFKKINHQFTQSKQKTLPLCAAENRISAFAKLPLSSDYQERYIMDGLLNFNPQNNFIGSSYLHEIYQLINYQCKKLYSCNYADARTLSGMNCVTSLLMSITTLGDKIMVSDSSNGGHQSMKIVCERLGLEIIDMPYDYESFNLDYDKIYDLLKENEIKFFLFAPSDIIFPPDFSRLKLPEHALFLYDASQTLGLIAGKQLPNPLNSIENLVLFGGTHKTIPGPAKGLIMTNNKEIAKQIDETISPKYVRHTQMHQVVSLLFSLFELEVFGESYSVKILDYANRLARGLASCGFTIPQINNEYTKTHQVFIQTSEAEMNTIYKNAFLNEVTLNKKSKKLFHNHGIRLGTQEIARLAWNQDPIENTIQIILSLLADPTITKKLMKQLTIPSELNFTFKTRGEF
ncbi:hypothetical protein IW492_03555 [Enterococcus sp. BWB1-3]|uniref:hypothetical protein n=1 Tax=Enterococcus sp. BWB1-3 TaxID=2787713 RepID=UPI001921CC9B|nr:hypothetical protein [Enterococcus sp. BWB1-3]MBL1228308.1 hypothetical protein [Enterococcus sp. BWB1-3]